MISFKISKYWSPSSPKVWIPKCMLLSRVVHYLSPGCESALCSLFQKQVCIDWSKSDPSDSISILWKTDSEVCLVFMSSVVATRCKSKLTPCHSTSPAPQPLCLSLLPPCLAHQAEVSYSQDNLLCRIDLNRNNKNQEQKSKGKPWLCSYI